MSDELPLFFYTPPLIADDERVAALVRLVEACFPGHRLFAAIDENGQPRAVEAPAAWLVREYRAGKAPVLCNANEDTYISLSIGDLEPLLGENLRVAQIALSLPEAPFVLEKVYDFIGRGGEATRAHWAHCAPFEATARIAKQVSPRRFGQSPAPDYELPALKLPKDPFSPYYLSWINYWSAPTVQLLGLAQPGELLPPFHRIDVLPSGAWIAQLTEAALDLERPDHLAALKAAYDRLPHFASRRYPAS